MSDSRKRRSKKLRLFAEQQGRCHYCMVGMELTFHEVKHPWNTLATLEHLDDRFSEERGQHGGERRVVLACMQCNHQRGTASQQQQTKEELWRRSGRAPQELRA